ncbi:MAG: SUKH-3 domain-containing protein [Ruminococcus sp.]|nr:SUKH-3 domain-containing protein [Ruminococcus sp.]
MLNNLAEMHLRRAGWYLGRKVDISDQIEFWESCGYQTFDAGIRFMEEFGKLHIVDKYIFIPMNSLHERHHTTFAAEILAFYNEYSEYEKFEFNLFGQSREKILPVIMFEDSDPVYIFISESGNFFCDSGLRADNVDVLWNEWYNWGLDHEPRGLVLEWSKYYAGEKREFMPGGNITRKYL